MHTTILRSHNRELRLEPFEWPAASSLARLYAAPSHKPLNGDRVTDVDALAFADALQRAAQDFSDADATEELPTLPWGEFAGPRKQRLHALINFCREGAFEIQHQ